MVLTAVMDWAHIALLIVAFSYYLLYLMGRAQVMELRERNEELLRIIDTVKGMKEGEPYQGHQ